MAKFNYKELYKAVATSEAGRKRVNTIMERKFVENKVLMMQEFNNHPVTQEIEAGVGAANSSETLGGKGDLFSFIGFNEGEDPVSPVRNVIETETTLAKSQKGVAGSNKVTYKFSLRIPSESIRKASPIPWESGKSWVEGIEKGISGFGNFLRGIFNSPKPSHSGGGIQSKTPVRDAEFKKRGYLSEIFAAFVSKFK